jgi:hypothetical protein
VARMVDPRMNRFRAMSLDEQVETLEQLSQESLRAREEMRSVEVVEAPHEFIETVEVPQALSVQGRGFPMALDV